MSIRRTVLATAALALVIPLAACGGSQDTPATTSPASSSSAPGEVAGTAGGQPSASEATDATTPEAAVTGDGSQSTAASPASPAASQARTAASQASAAASLPAGVKKFATATLPAKVGNYTGNNGMYTGGSQDDMVMMTLSPNLEFTKVVGKLSGKVTDGLATCGTADGVTSCFAPLDGGVLWLQGTDQTKAVELAQLTKQVYATFA
ncbi:MULTISPECIES: hypothetical protein [unclassified Luteococcus]|uniref:hypothetical protein n=1 Tax=unclassified Luteococcus TaxID=2639923 RepID=UPI00313EC4F9